MISLLHSVILQLVSYSATSLHGGPILKNRPTVFCRILSKGKSSFFQILFHFTFYEVEMMAFSCTSVIPITWSTERLSHRLNLTQNKTCVVTKVHTTGIAYSEVALKPDSGIWGQAVFFSMCKFL